jgi:CheY-like chemotaxis protein
VLVVDDNVDGAQSLAMLLGLIGHEVRVAYDGPEALEVAAEFCPEVVLLDVGLPRGMDGYEVARRLRARPGTETAELVAVTGHGSEEERAHAREAGFSSHFVKPVDLGGLFNLLDRRAGG